MVCGWWLMNYNSVGVSWINSKGELEIQEGQIVDGDFLNLNGRIVRSLHSITSIRSGHVVIFLYFLLFLFGVNSVGYSFRRSQCYVIFSARIMITNSKLSYWNHLIISNRTANWAIHTLIGSDRYFVTYY